MSKLNIDDIVRENITKIVEEIGEIPKENRGKFTATQKRTGKSTEELCHSKNPLTRKRANFAKMAKRGWKPLKENDEYEDLTPFEEYQEGYPNDDFDVSDMSADQLARWCESVGDFLYIYKGLRGWSIMVANTDEIVFDIALDLHNCERIEPTHEVDYLFASRQNEFENDYICVFKVIGTKDGDYYVIYQQEKSGKYVQESRTRWLNESFNSNELRGWFKLHGGVKNRYDEPEYNNLKDKRVFQDGLGDVKDEDIVYLEEFPNYNDAYYKKRSLTKSDSYTRQRSDWDMKAHFAIYKANDGSCLLVGLDRNTVPTGITDGGSKVTKKVADRVNSNGWNFKTRSNRYVDDSDTYYYGKKGNYFGLYKNDNYKGLKSDNERIKNDMSDDEWKAYQDKRVKNIRDFRNKN